MQLGLLKSLHDHDFYESVKLRLSDEFFGEDELKVKHTLDTAQKEFKRDLTVDEVAALFFTENPTLTTAQKNLHNDLFHRLKNEQPMGEDIVEKVLTSMWRGVVGERMTNIGFQLVNGDLNDMSHLRRLLEDHTDDFLPKLNVEFEDLSIEALLKKNKEESRWRFNLPTLAHRVAGVNDGHFVVVGARPNVGKTSFHASMVAGPDGFAAQGARVAVLCNEEAAHRVGIRYLTACVGKSASEIRMDVKAASEKFKRIRDNIMLVDASGWDTNRIESMCKSYEPDVMIIDMIDKVNVYGSHAREDQRLRAVYQTSRDISKEWGCAVFGFSQLSADAEGRTRINQSMLEGSKTGKAAEADLMLLIGKAPVVEGQSEEDPWRYLNIVKNKLSGWHGTEMVQFDGYTSRYTVDGEFKELTNEAS